MARTSSFYYFWNSIDSFSKCIFYAKHHLGIVQSITSLCNKFLMTVNLFMLQPEFASAPLLDHIYSA